MNLRGTRLKMQASLAEVRKGMDRTRSTNPLDRCHILALIARDCDILVVKIESVDSAEVVVKALALVVCVAEVEHRLGSPESSRTAGDFDGCASAREVLFLSPESVRLHFGGVADTRTDRGYEDVEVAVVVDDDRGCGKACSRESETAEDCGEAHGGNDIMKIFAWHQR